MNENGKRAAHAGLGVFMNSFCRFSRSLISFTLRFCHPTSELRGGFGAAKDVPLELLGILLHDNCTAKPTKLPCLGAACACT
ncbi:hypothetical protein SAMN05216603_1022 [Pseudomonas benzenivorans]|nr:hypothetical protein SAMN05216603_1022 [Pseudomonas benzenivorans]